MATRRIIEDVPERFVKFRTVVRNFIDRNNIEHLNISFNSSKGKANDIEEFCINVSGKEFGVDIARIPGNELVYYKTIVLTPEEEKLNIQMEIKRLQERYNLI